MPSCCCRSGPCQEMFTAKDAQKTLRRYLKKGPTRLERRLIAAVPREVLSRARVLEIGGGIGTIQADLIAAGADGGEIVELVPAYEHYARELAREKGIENQTSFRVADVLEQPSAVAPADIVVLNRVVCCSPDGVRLTAVAARLAARMLLIVYPRDRFVVQTVMRIGNTALRVMGRSFQAFVHSPASLHSAARNEGLTIADSGRGFVWEYAALRRTGMVESRGPV